MSEQDKEMIKDLDLLMNLDLFEEPEVSEIIQSLDEIEAAPDEEGAE